jgi:hypothetical protein
MITATTLITEGHPAEQVDRKIARPVASGRQFFILAFAWSIFL